MLPGARARGEALRGVGRVGSQGTAPASTCSPQRAQIWNGSCNNCGKIPFLDVPSTRRRSAARHGGGDCRLMAAALWLAGDWLASWLVVLVRQTISNARNVL